LVFMITEELILFEVPPIWLVMSLMPEKDAA
jgi:hypothetical protein